MAGKVDQDQLGVSEKQQIDLFVASLALVDVGLGVSKESVDGQGTSEGAESLTSRASVAAVLSQYRSGMEELYS
jgi:hypothetical protein